MKLSICLTVALTALSVAAAPSLTSPVHLQERGKFGAAASLVKAGSKVKVPHHVRLPPKRPYGRSAPHKPSGKPSHLAPHKPSPPARRPLVKLPAQNQIQQQPKPRPAPPPPQNQQRPKSRPAPPRPSNSDPLSGVGDFIKDVASDLVPHFDLGSIF
ncbi:hypothetical protein M378DRAFT_170155 [Amanita muscaria Koide BX008]|uniref:Uncharacterized protein n=1 Tax=Amanita muscaria (strain Koide BX008) TaxID=946122 RepID=A0A0C2WPZ8_AMAMK|nr:hypothetical protein M378DRAFT_170155 [Amanita muscaria Koide BX008]